MQSFEEKNATSFWWFFKLFKLFDLRVSIYQYLCVNKLAPCNSKNASLISRFFCSWRNILYEHGLFFCHSKWFLCSKEQPMKCSEMYILLLCTFLAALHLNFFHEQKTHYESRHITEILRKNSIIPLQLSKKPPSVKCDIKRGDHQHQMTVFLSFFCMLLNVVFERIHTKEFTENKINSSWQCVLGCSSRSSLLRCLFIWFFFFHELLIVRCFILTLPVICQTTPFMQKERILVLAFFCLILCVTADTCFDVHIST